MFQQDFIKRQIELLARAIAGIAKKRQEGEVQEALAEARKAYDTLGIDRALLRLDSQSIARMVRDRQKLSALCELLEEEARVHEALGNAPACEDLRLQATEIRRAAQL